MTSSAPWGRAHPLRGALAAAATVAVATALLAPSVARADDRESTTTTVATAGATSFAATGGSYAAIPERQLAELARGRRASCCDVDTIAVAGHAGVPSSGVSAVMVVIGALDKTTGGTVRVSPDVASLDGASTSVRFSRGVDTSNQALVPLSSTGTIAVRAPGSTRVRVSVVGWVGSDAAAPGTGTLPVRARTVYSTHQHRSVRAALGRGRSATIDLRSVVPAGARAVVVDVTADHVAHAGSLVLHAASTRAPAAPTLPLTRRVATTNQATVPLSSDRRLVLSTGGVPADVTIDLQGVVLAAADHAAGLHVVSPQRVLDTRSPARGRVVTVPVAGSHGVPRGATAATVHLTVVSGSHYGVTAVEGHGALRQGVLPVTGAPAHSLASSTMTVPLGPDGALRVLRTDTGTNAVLDVVGWSAGAPTPPVQAPDLRQRAPASSGTPSSPDPTPAGPTTGDLTGELLTGVDHYAMTTWWDQVRPRLTGQQLRQTTLRAQHLLIDRAGSAPSRNVKNDPDADPIRRLAMMSLPIATTLAAGAWDERATGVSATVATQRLVELITTVASQHASNHVDGWGGAAQQGSMDASYLGKAAWLEWSALPAATRTLVTRMVLFEADDAAGWAIDYYRDRAGDYLNKPGDTGAEDTSWRVLPDQLALAMFPTSPHHAIWAHQVDLAALAAWARPSDTANSTVVNGTAVGDWIDGSNVEPDGTVVNHDRVAPDYAALITQNLDRVWVDTLVHHPTPEAARALLGPVHDVFTDLPFASPPNQAPGGTIYTPDSATIYFPQANDWGDRQYLVYALMDLESAGYDVGDDPARSARDALLHLQAAVDMQDRFADGHTYDATAQPAEFNYVGREELAGQLIAQCFLVDRTLAHTSPTFTNSPEGDS